MKYTDKELIRASQIAYFTINNDVIREAQTTSYTLLELLEHSDTFKRSVYEDIINLSKTDNYMATTDSTKDEVLKHISDPKTEKLIEEKFAIIDAIKTGKIGSWKVVSYVDNNAIGEEGRAGKLVDGVWDHQSFSSSGDGLAAMVFETGDGQAITAFRGSEGLDNLNDILTDWIASDGGLGLSDRDTPQQSSVYKYMEDYVLDLGYDDMTLTGHSLGGNLAMHAAVSSYEISKDKAGNMISNVVSFDGPGFSDEYMIRHYFAISSINGQRKTTLSHYTWSIVGVLLNHLNDTYDWKTYVDCRDDNLSKVPLGTGDRHDMSFAQYDNNGNLLPATQDDLAALRFSENVDEFLIDYILKIPEEKRPNAISLLLGMVDCAANYTEDGELNFQDFFDLFNVLFNAYIDNVSGLDAVYLRFFASGFVYNFASKSIISFLVDNTYKLSELFAKGKHEIKDNFGVNQIYFPEGVKPENIKVSIERLCDVKIVIYYDNGETDYIILRNYAHRVDDMSFLLFFTYPAEKNGVISEETLIMSADHKSSPFRTLYGTPGDDMIRPIFHDTYPATIFGGDGDDQLVGSNGDDKIYGGNGNDFFEWNPGDDYLEGGEGNDKYNYGVNCNNDTIFDSDGQNTVHFYGLTQNDLSLRYCQNGDVVFTVKETGETLTIENFQNRFVYRNFLFEFADGQTIRAGDLDDDGNEDDIFTKIEGTDQDDVLYSFLDNSAVYGRGGNDIIKDSKNDAMLYGGNGDDEIYGNGGFDLLYGGNGNDLLDGGEGNDYLNGGDGDDIYIYGKGSGKDTIEDGNGTNRIWFTNLMPNDLTVYYPPSNNAAILTITETGETLTIRNFRSYWNWRNFNLKFADGSTMSVADIRSPFLHVVGTNGDDENIISFFRNSIIEVLDGNDNVTASNENDFIYGGAGSDSLNGNGGNDFIDGGEGDDYLNGGSGDDTYIYGKGSGDDTIEDSAGENRIRFTDLMPDDLTVYYKPSNQDAILTITETGEKLTIKNFRSYWNWRNYILEFADGTTLPVGETGSPFLHVVGTNGDDENIISVFTNSTIEALDGNDKVNAGDKDDLIFGGAGKDSLYGKGGNDILDGGEGDDYLEGGSGDDTYIYGKGSGNDTILDNIGDNRIKFTELMPDDLTVYYKPSNQDAILTITETGETLTIQNFRSGDSYRKFDLEFADGTTLSIDETGSPFLHVVGTNGDDEGIISFFPNSIIEVLDGNDKVNDANVSDFIYGGAGNDSLYGNGGNDVLDGGEGNDYLEGGSGDDTYIYGKGSGNDTIADSAGENRIQFIDLMPDDLTVYYKPSNHDAILTVTGTGQTLTIQNFRSGELFRNFDLEFADGTTLSIDETGSPFLHVVGTNGDDGNIISFFTNSIIEALDGNDKVNAGDKDDLIYGGAGKDSLYGKGGNDVLDGGEGDDYLDGGSGDDTYIYGKGSGNDTIADSAGENRIRFTDLMPDDLTVYYPPSNNYAILTITETGETLTIQNFRSGWNLRNFILEFADGTTLSVDETGSPFLHVVGTNGDDGNIISFFTNSIIEALDGNDEVRAANVDDFIYGGAGNDYLYGNGGNDTLDGGTGDDYLEGGSGDDTYIFGTKSGNDTILDNVGENRIKFTDLMPDDLTVYYPPSNHDAILTITETGETLTIQNFRSGVNWRNFILEFENGRIGKIDYISPLIAFDPLTVTFGIGSGNVVVPNDVIGEIKFDGLSPTDLTAFYSDNNAVLTITSTGEKLTIENFSGFVETQKTVLSFNNDVKMRFDSGGSPFLNVAGTDLDDTITAFFANSVVNGLSGNDILTGTSGKDTLYGGEGEDILNGGEGDDYLDGGDGNDTYIYGSGFGNDVINDVDGIDKIKLIGLNAADLSVNRVDENNIIVLMIVATGETLTINNFRKEDVDPSFVFEFEDMSTGTIDWDKAAFVINDLEIGEDSNLDKIVIFEIGNGDHAISADSGIDKIKFIGLTSTDLTAYFAADGSVVLTVAETGEKFTIENFEEFVDTAVVLEFENQEMRLDDRESPFLNVVGTDSDDEITAFYKNSSMFGGIGNDTYSLAAGFGSNVIEDNDGDNKVELLGINSDAVSFELTDSGELVITITESGDVLTIRNFDSERFTFKFADEVSGTFNVETGEFERILSEEELAAIEAAKTEDELVQANADILDELYTDEDSVSDLLTENDDTVISEVTDSVSTTDENMADQIDIQVMILTENMAAFSNESNISDSMNMQSNVEDYAFASQLLVGT